MSSGGREEPGQRPVDAALLILDMQNDIIGRHLDGDGRGGAMDVGDLISRIVALRDAFRQVGWPVIYTRVAYRAGYADAHVTAPARARSSLREGEPSSAVIDELAPAADDYVVIKRRIGAFYQTDLELLLRGLDRAAIVVTGTSLPRAVESTVREAHSRDIRCIVVSDASYAASREEHEHCLGVLGKYGFADVMDTAAVLSAIQKEQDL